VDALVEQLPAAGYIGIHAPLALVSRPAAVPIPTANEENIADLSRRRELVGPPDRRMVSVIDPT